MANVGIHATAAARRLGSTYVSVTPTDQWLNEFLTTLDTMRLFAETAISDRQRPVGRFRTSGGKRCPCLNPKVLMPTSTTVSTRARSVSPVARHRSSVPATFTFQVDTVPESSRAPPSLEATTPSYAAAQESSTSYALQSQFQDQLIMQQQQFRQELQAARLEWFNHMQQMEHAHTSRSDTLQDQLAQVWQKVDANQQQWQQVLQQRSQVSAPHSPDTSALHACIVQFHQSFDQWKLEQQDAMQQIKHSHTHEIEQLREQVDQGSAQLALLRQQSAGGTSKAIDEEVRAIRQELNQQITCISSELKQHEQRHQTEVHDQLRRTHMEFQEQITVCIQREQIQPLITQWKQFADEQSKLAQQSRIEQAQWTTQQADHVDRLHVCQESIDECVRQMEDYDKQLDEMRSWCQTTLVASICEAVKRQQPPTSTAPPCTLKRPVPLATSSVGASTVPAASSPPPPPAGVDTSVRLQLEQLMQRVHKWEEQWHASQVLRNLDKMAKVRDTLITHQTHLNSLESRCNELAASVVQCMVRPHRAPDANGVDEEDEIGVHCTKSSSTRQTSIAVSSESHSIVDTTVNEMKQLQESYRLQITQLQQLLEQVQQRVHTVERDQQKQTTHTHSEYALDSAIQQRLSVLEQRLRDHQHPEYMLDALRQQMNLLQQVQREQAQQAQQAQQQNQPPREWTQIESRQIEMRALLDTTVGRTQAVERELTQWPREIERQNDLLMNMRNGIKDWQEKRDAEFHALVKQLEDLWLEPPAASPAAPRHPGEEPARPIPQFMRTDSSSSEDKTVMQPLASQPNSPPSGDDTISSSTCCAPTVVMSTEEQKQVRERKKLEKEVHRRQEEQKKREERERKAREKEEAEQKKRQEKLELEQKRKADREKLMMERERKLQAIAQEKKDQEIRDKEAAEQKRLEELREQELIAERERQERLRLEQAEAERVRQEQVLRAEEQRRKQEAEEQHQRDVEEAKQREREATKRREEQEQQRQREEQQHKHLEEQKRRSRDKERVDQQVQQQQIAEQARVERQRRQVSPAPATPTEPSKKPRYYSSSTHPRSSGEGQRETYDVGASPIVERPEFTMEEQSAVTKRRLYKPAPAPVESGNVKPPDPPTHSLSPPPAARPNAGNAGGSSSSSSASDGYSMAALLPFMMANNTASATAPRQATAPANASVVSLLTTSTPSTASATSTPAASNHNSASSSTGNGNAAAVPVTTINNQTRTTVARPAPHTTAPSSLVIDTLSVSTQERSNLARTSTNSSSSVPSTPTSSAAARRHLYSSNPNSPGTNPFKDPGIYYIGEKEPSSAGTSASYTHSPVRTPISYVGSAPTSASTTPRHSTALASPIPRGGTATASAAGGTSLLMLSDSDSSSDEDAEKLRSGFKR